jgi:ribosomal-protein-alanine N-acetyltransferase
MNRPKADPDFRLIACDADGRPDEPVAELPSAIAEACKGCSDLYKRLGYRPPWVSYIALYSDAAVGSGAFVGPPVEGRVEIAYFTLPEHEGNGFATLTAQGLIAIAQECQPKVEIFAKTTPEANASTAILTKLGFEFVGTTIDHEIGEAWAWLLAPPSTSLAGVPGDAGG